MKLTATNHIWSQGNHTVYEDDQGRRWIAYTHQITEDGNKIGCYCRIKKQEKELRHESPITNWIVTFGKKEDRNHFIPYGDKETTINMNGIQRNDCDCWITLHTIASLIEDFHTEKKETP